MKTQFTKNYLSLAILSVLLLPAVNSHAAETTRVSVDSTGKQGISHSFGSFISADGRFVTFTSYAPNIVAGDNNKHLADIFVHDRTTGATTRVSVDSAGRQANSGSFASAISADGRYVAFLSEASNLVANDTNGLGDVFVHDRIAGTTTRVNVSSAGQQGNSRSFAGSISADGRFVSFESEASNLVDDDTNGEFDTFIHDRITGTTTRISVDSAGQQGNRGSFESAISADGRFVAFHSEASNLVAGDTNEAADVFVHDRTTGTTTRVSVDSAGEQGNSYLSFQPDISADGRFVVFTSDATNLVEGDTNAIHDVFVHDRTTGKTTRVSVDSAGLQATDGISAEPAISADGRFVTFESTASNLVADDTNGVSDNFIHDRLTGVTTRVSVNSQRIQGDSSSYLPSINADGRFVVFQSHATNLVAKDTNEAEDIFVRDRQLVQNKTADLQLAVTSQPASAPTGQTASYTYTLTNNGPDNISSTAVKLINVISNGDLVSLTPSQGSCKKAAVSVCRFGSLATGASVTLTAEIKAGSDPLTQQLSVNAPPVDDVPDNNSVTVSTPVTP